MEIHEYIAHLESKLAAARLVAADMDGGSVGNGMAAPKLRGRIKRAKAAKPAGKGKRRMSAAGRARLSRLAKLRWKKSRALGKSTL
jgi:hypothetical protein